jgi:hypothetical protein
MGVRGKCAAGLVPNVNDLHALIPATVKDVHNMPAGQSENMIHPFPLQCPGEQPSTTNCAHEMDLHAYVGRQTAIYS